MIFLVLFLGSFLCFSEIPQEQVITASPDASIEKTEDESFNESSSIEEPKNKISESFSFKKQESINGESFFNSLIENYSWFFQKRNTEKKLVLIPVFYMSRLRGGVLGARLFSYSTREKDYLGTSFSNQFSSSLFKWEFDYINQDQTGFTVDSYMAYDGFVEFFYGFGMKTKDSDLKKLYPHKFIWDYKIKYMSKKHWFSSVTTRVLIRKERKNLQNKEIVFAPEVLFHLEGRIGYDSRDYEINTMSGHYYQISFGCTPSLGNESSFCVTEADLRYYYDFFQDYVLALRTFVGSSLISRISYSMKYSLGGDEVLRGFSENRFLGDRIHFSQAEIRAPLPIWSQFLSGVLFAEYGGLGGHKEDLKDFEWNVGTGLRLGMPPDYKMKLRMDFGFAISNKERPFNFLVDFFQAF